MSVTGVISNGVVVFPVGVSFPEGTKVDVTPRELPKMETSPSTLQFQKKRQFGSAKGLLTVPEDFDAPIDDFGEDV